LTKCSDGLHYDTDGQLELGRRFAQAYLALVKEYGVKEETLISLPANIFSRFGVMRAK